MRSAVQGGTAILQLLEAYIRCKMFKANLRSSVLQAAARAPRIRRSFRTQVRAEYMKEKTSFNVENMRTFKYFWKFGAVFGVQNCPLPRR